MSTGIDKLRQESGASFDSNGSQSTQPVFPADHAHEKVQQTPSACQCRTDPSDPGRNLVVCLDGTANQFGPKNSNVVELYSRLEKSKDQLTYYDSGIGTYAKPSYASFRYWRQAINHAVDMAIAWNFERNVLSAYQWLSEIYETGDRIYLIGFSRGAYQARVIAGMIEKVGLLHKGNNNQIPFAFEIYAAATQRSRRENSSRKRKNKAQKGKPDNPTKQNVPTSSPSQEEDIDEAGTPPTADDLCEHFKTTLSRRGVKVHFVGTWDTVSSVGVARDPSLPETTAGMKHVCVFRHALALDERRVKFLPEYADGGAGPSYGGNVKEVWFVGSHSDIGGGNTQNLKLTRFGPALRWMTYEAMTHGLKMEPYHGRWFELEPKESLNGVWKALEVLPLRRLSYKDKDSSTSWPHFGGPRLVQAGQRIHQSVIDAIERKQGQYQPRAHIHGNTTWDVRKLRNSGMIEQDPYASAGSILDDMADPSKFLTDEISFHTLMGLTASDIGLRSITETPGAVASLIGALDAYHASRANTKREQAVIDALVEALSAFPSQPPSQRISNPKIRDLVGIASSRYATKLNQLFACIGKEPFHGHTDWINSVAFSPDGSRIVSGSYDHTIRIWDSLTGVEVFAPLSGHSGNVRSVAFSPDGSRIVSGSDDCSIRIWDPNTGEEIMGPLAGYIGMIWCVTFSPDGSQFASGSSDKTIRVWDSQTGLQVLGPLFGHPGAIFSVAFTPDGQRIVSSGCDTSIFIWDVHTGNMTMQGSFVGHTDWVRCVAVSNDSLRIVSCSDDRSIRMWDARTGREVTTGPVPLSLYPRMVFSVAFSPDGKKVISGSTDGAIRVLDASTGKELVHLARGHTALVRSVAVSHDGARFVSGSWDGTIRVWDLRTGRQVLGPVSK